MPYFWSEPSSTSILHDCKQQRFWQDCADELAWALAVADRIRTKISCAGSYMELKKCYPFKCQSGLQQMTNFATSFLVFEKIRYDISWESSASRQFSWISFLICYFWKSGKIWNFRLLQIIGGALRVITWTFLTTIADSLRLFWL